MLATVLSCSAFAATPAFANTHTASPTAGLTKASQTPAPAAVAAFVEDLNRLNQRVATDSSLDLVAANALYSNLWKKAAGKSISLSVPQKRDSASARRAAKFPTYAAVLSLRYRGVSYCVVADRFIATERAPYTSWTQSLLRGSCSTYFKLVTL